MNRKAVSGLMLMLLLISILTFTLHPIYAKPTTTRALETPVDDENLHKQPSLTSHTPEWNQTYGGTNTDEAWSVVETGDGGYAMAGSTRSFGAGYEDFWLVKTDADGNAQWNQTYGGTSYDWGRSVVGTVDGGYALAGYTRSFGAGGDDFWLVKTDAAGNVVWNQTYGGARPDSALSVVETGDGGYALAGSTYSFGVGYADFWLIKLAGPPLPETIDELKVKVEELGSEGEIDNQGIVKSLIAKLNVAQKWVEGGKIDQAINMLNSFINKVQAQSGKHITPEAADILIGSAEHLLSHL